MGGLDAVRRAAERVDVPGTPRSLRLDDVRIDGGRCAVTWSYADPEKRRSGARVTGRTEGAPGAALWATAQLDAARAFKDQLDLDIVPGEPPRTRHWTPDEAWAALVSFLGRGGVEVRDAPGGLHTVDPGQDREETTFRLGRVEWAAYLNRHEQMLEGSDQTEVVPALVPRDDGALPLWVVDDLWELAATREVVVLREGRLRGERSRLR